MITTKQQIASQPQFAQDELITWHEYQGDKCVPVPGVVVRQEKGNVLIRTRVAGLFKELVVQPEQLAHR